MTELIGIYGAALATALAVREIWLHRKRQIPRFDVAASMLMLLERVTQVSREALQGKEDQDVPWMITVETVNRGGAKQFVTGVEIVQDFGRDGSRRDRADLDYPISLEPGEPLTVEYTSDASKVDLSYAIWAEVSVSSGATFASDSFGPKAGQGLSVTFPRSDIRELQELVESLGFDFPRIPIHEVRRPGGRPLPRRETG